MTTKILTWSLASLLAILFVVATSTTPAGAQDIPVTGDRLVLKDGTIVEMKGEWQRQGSRLTFRTKQGVLTSVRSELVDFDASIATPSSSKPAPVAASKRVADPQRRTLVLKDGDVATFKSPPAPVEAEEALSGDDPLEPQAVATAAVADASSEPTTVTPTEPPRAARPAGGFKQPGYEVESWRDVSTDEEPALIYGNLVSRSTDSIPSVVVRVKLYDEGGGELDDQTATVVTAGMRPGESENFRVYFPGVTSYREIEFIVEEP